MPEPPALSAGLELPPLGAGNCQKAVAAWAEWQDEPPPGPRALGIAPADGQGEHDAGHAVAEMAGWHGPSLASRRMHTEGYLTRSGIGP